MLKRIRILAFCLLLAFGLSLSAHVGSADVYLEGSAGPYRMTVVVRPPEIVPGIAMVEVYLRGKLTAAQIPALRIQPVTYGTQKLGAPVPDVLKQSAGDPNYFTGQIWFMGSGSYSVRVIASGSLGDGVMTVPTPSTARAVKDMPQYLGAILFGLLLFLVVGAVSVVGAAAREAELQPGAAPGAREKRRARIAMFAAVLLATGAVWFGNSWWTAEASAYSQNIFKPLELKPSVATLGGVTRLALDLHDPGWVSARRSDDLVEDHGHLMHLFVLRFPELDAFYHLHPTAAGATRYELPLPSMPAGRYRLFADIVHENGFPETPSGEITVAATSGSPLSGDDSTAAALPDGLKLVWDRPAEIVAKRPLSLQFRLLDAAGKPAEGMEPYMGMAGHAVVARRDLAVFAHLHPMGTVPMASLMAFGDHSMHQAANITAAVSFPFGFPQPGSYRVWIQVKNKGRVLTSPFDCDVKP